MNRSWLSFGAQARSMQQKPAAQASHKKDHRISPAHE